VRKSVIAVDFQRILSVRSDLSQSRSYLVSNFVIEDGKETFQIV
jgi:hypothetical protein